MLIKIEKTKHRFYKLNKLNKLIKPYSYKLRNKQHKQSGHIVILLVVKILIVVLAIVVLLAIVSLITMPKGELNTNDGTSGGELAKGDSNNLPGLGDTTNSFTNTDTNNLPAKDDNSQDLSNTYLVCVNLPGVNFPRTPALDRRVALMYLSVKRDLDAQGVPPLRFSWGFRSNCQQINVVPSANANGVNPKAKPGTSPHEAGRALDVRDMTRRSDVGIIVATFNKHGWRWLAQKDPPHFDVLGYRVGEASHGKWIQKIQASFNAGYPKEGCRGTNCGQ